MSIQYCVDNSGSIVAIKYYNGYGWCSAIAYVDILII